MSTASGVVFAGDNEGFFNAFEGKTRQALWSYRTGSPIWGAAASTYMLDGRQYVLIESGNTLVGVRRPGEVRTATMRQVGQVGQVGRVGQVAENVVTGRGCRRLFAGARRSSLRAAAGTGHAAAAAQLAGDAGAAGRCSTRRCSRSACRRWRPGSSTRGASRSCPNGDMLVTERPGPAAHRAQRRARPDADCRRAGAARRRARRAARDRAASALRREPRRLPHLFEGARRGQALHHGARARAPSTARRSSA